MSATHEHRGDGEGERGVGPRVPTTSPSNPNVPTTSPSNPKLLTILRSKLRVGHYSRRTEQAYVSWTRRFVRHHGLVHPAELAEPEVVSFLRYLAEDRHVAQATQAQALAALQFLYQHVLGRPLRLEGRLPRARTPKRLPVVLSRTEVVRVLAQLRGVYAMIGLLLYGSGMRLMECLTLRIKDVDLERGEIRIRRGKGGVDRVTVLPQNVRASLTGHLEQVRAQHREDLAAGGGRVPLPGALDRKLPRGGLEWPWQWLFPATRRWRSDFTGERGRHHLDPSAVQRAMGAAVRRSGIGSGRRVTRFGTASRRICWSRDTTSGRCRSYWGTAM